MSRGLVLVTAAFALVAATQTTTFISDSPSFWRQWISLIFSRGLYFVLAFLILCCFIITHIRNKFEEGSHSQGKTEGMWSTQGTVVKSFLMPPTDIQTNRSSTLTEMFNTNTNLDVLKEAEARNNALKKELDQLNRIRLSLEERSGTLEREKAAVEDQLEETRLKSALESEGLRKEAAVIQRQLQQVQEEKDMLSREVESANRESRMTDCALKDQALLAERLEAARKEVADLQKGLETLRKERDTAVAIAADLAVRCQGVAGESTQLIGKFIKREMERSKDKEQSTLKLVAGSKTDMPNHGDSEKKEDNGECHLRTAEPESCNEINELGESNTSVEIDCECQECAKQQIRWNEMMQHQDQYLPCNELGLGPVTGSEAFRNFLISSFSED